MQFSDVLCYIVLMITVTASCARVEEQSKEAEEVQDVKRISKRDATVIYDFDGNQMDKIFQKPKVIYRRLSKARYEPKKYGPPKARYGPPRPKHRPHKSTRKSAKKGRTGKPKTLSPKYGPPEPRYKHKSYSNKKQNNKYGVRKFRPNPRPGHGHVVKMPHYSVFVPDKTGFGEPPAHNDNGPQKSYSYDPPVDSYGAPLKPGIVDVYSGSNSFQDASQHDDLIDEQKPQRNHNYIDIFDNNYAFTKKEPSFSNFVTLNPKDSHIDSLDPVDKPDLKKLYHKKTRPLKDSKVVNRPWRSNKPDNYEDEIIVGGQYAEPPARHVTKNVRYSPIIGDNFDDEPFPNLRGVRGGYVDIEGAQSANQSPYSNYKNSNMAFSPQNLNDAFSIVDK